MSDLLELKGLSVGFTDASGTLYAVSDLDLRIGPGTIYTLVGESGCGKSTVAFSIMRLLDERAEMSGKVFYKGTDLEQLPEHEIESVRGSQIGMIFQDPLNSLNPVYRVGDQIAEAIMLDRISRKEALQKAEELLSQVHIPDPGTCMKRFPHELSGGMRQRVMIAMMLSRSPELLIADEPTTALDVTVESRILEILRERKEKYNTSVLLITHDFGVVAEVADRIGVMYAGELIEEGDVFEIFDHPCHPYTRSLLRALPRITKSEGRLESIEGSVPRIMGKPACCRFHNRCPYAEDKCRCEMPPLHAVSEGHTYRCHREVQNEYAGD